MKANRSRNRLYKKTVEVDNANTRCLQLSKVGDSATWHARLGHVGRFSGRAFGKKKMEVGLVRRVSEMWKSL